jgi:glucokinase
MNQGSEDNITSVMVASAARRGDLLSNEVVKLAGRYLGIGLANIVNIFNPDMIVIGGGVSKMGELILKPARKTMKEHAFKLPARRVSVVKSRLGENAGVIGASIYVTKRVGC